jgi:hypothetical protein
MSGANWWRGMANGNNRLKKNRLVVAKIGDASTAALAAYQRERDLAIPELPIARI